MQKSVVERLYKASINDYLDMECLAERAKVNIGAMKFAQHKLGYYEGMCVAYGIILGKSYQDFQQDVKETEAERCLTEVVNSLRMQ